MSNWFDGLAKRAGRAVATQAPSESSSAADESGLSRRQVLTRGAVITGVAWTAPALLAARPAFAGASICTDSRFPDYSVCPDGKGTEMCCPAGQKCVLNTKGQYVCDLPVGADCGNRGNGQCNGGFSRCDQPANTTRNGICGGPGSICSDGSDCVEGNCSTSDGFCGGVGALCTTTAQCAPEDPNHKIALICTNGTCQLP